VVLRVRGSTSSLGKTDIAKRLWRRLALSGVSTRLRRLFACSNYAQNPVTA